MTDAEKRVIDAAKAWRMSVASTRRNLAAGEQRLKAAVDALLAAEGTVVQVQRGGQ